MTQAQYQWLQDNGYDPTIYDVDTRGRVIKSPVAAPATQQKMSPLRAAGTSFLGNLLPSAAGLGGAKLGMMAGAPFGPVGVGLGAIGGGLGAGYLTGRGQEAALEQIAPSALEEMRRAETDQPVASYLGGFAPNALAFRPSVQGMKGLLRPTVRGTETLGEALAKPEFIAPAANIAANVAGSTAGQLVNVAQGGEFSAPRFAADVALGTLFNKPNALGRRIGFQDIPEPRREAPGDLAAAREQAAFMEYPPQDFITPREERGAQDIKTPGVNITPEGPEQFFTAEGKRMTEKSMAKDYTNWWKSETEPTTDLIKGAAEEIKMKVPKERLAELAQDPEVGAALRDPSRMPAFIAKQAEQSLEDVYQMMVRAETKGKFATPEEAANQRALQELRAERGLPSETPLSDVEAAYAARQRTPTGQAQELYGPELIGISGRPPSVSKASEGYQLIPPTEPPKSAIEASREVYGAELEGASGRPPSVGQVAKADKTAYEAYSGVRPEPEVRNATNAAREIYTRLQRPAEEYTGKITQEDINLATEIANRRGLKIELDRAYAGSQQVRGLYMVDADGNRIIRVNPLMATADTAIHEIGHDIFKGVTNKGMRRSLMDTAMDTPAYKAELAARAEEVKQGKITQEQANDIALEEGLIQAFGEQMPQVKRGELRAWYQAFKASMKQLVTGKMSPEDALAWMHYATTEAVPWKGVAVAKTGDVGEERMQRPVDEQAINQMIGESVSDNIKPLVEAINLKYEDIINSTGMMPEMKSSLGNYIQQVVQENPSAFDYFRYKVGDKTFANKEIGQLRGVNEAVKESLLTGKPIELSESAANNYKAMAQDVIKTMRELNVDNNKVSNIEQLLNVLVNRKIQNDPNIIQQNENVKRWSDPAFRQQQNSDYKRYNYQRAVQELAELEGQLPKKTFDPLNKDIRYQRGPIDRLRNFSEIDSLESRGGIFTQVAQGMRSYYATRKFMQGQASSKERIMSSLSPEFQVMLGKHIGQEFDQQRFIQPPSEIAAAYNEYRNEWQKFWPTETNKAGHTIRTAGGQRARLTDPYYGPFHMWSDSVRDIITTKQGSPEYVKLKDDYIKQHTQFHQQNGVPLQEAQTRSLVEFNDAIREMSVPYDPTAVGTFAGARKAQGIPLPDSWREYNIMKLVENYDRRSAMDYAMQEHMEKSPEIMAALGAEKYFNDQPIPPQIKASVPYIGDDNSVKSILREMSGKPAFRPDALGAGASRSIGALTIGTVSKATEVPTTMIAGLRYLQMSDYLPGTMKFIENLADWSALQERSYASGLNKRDGAQNMRQVAGVIGDASGYMNKFAETVSKYTGLNALEDAARTMAQGWGEVLVQINKRKAATGDKEAVRMLDSLSPDWRTRSDADLAGQFGQLMQGSYDMTQLPAWMLESGAAPYLTWMKWSAGQYNSFMKFAIEPALQGNVKPLLGHLLIGVMGGAAVEQIREWMNNREGRDVNWSELESWMQQNQGELGAEGMKQLSVKLLNMVQNVGTFGIAGDLAKMVTTAAVGGTAQGIATAPVANAVFDTSKKIAAALKAIDDGEDFGLVLRQMMLDVAKSHVQVARVGQNWLDEDENLRYDDRRKRRLFDELTGAPTQSGAFSVNYGNLAEREFERGEITEKTGEEAFSLVSRAREEATTPEDYASRIRKYKTSQNQIMPSLERQPMKAARYLSFVEGAEEGAGAETLKRYLTREQENKYRKSLIEGMSGLR
jgi:hypothetical protein